MNTGVTQKLKDTENALRYFIAFILDKQFGAEWPSKCGVSDDRLSKWKDLQEEERKRQVSGATDERLIYYADFYDLKTILKKHWQYFSSALGDRKTTEVYLTELEKLRNSDAHRRELLQHQKDLILGISGDLRTKISRYLSKQENSDSYYPRIEFAADNLDNSWKLGENAWVKTGKKLRQGDLLEFVVAVFDPLGEKLEYQCTFGAGYPQYSPRWSHENTFKYTVTENDVCKLFFAIISIRSKRKYHALGDRDDNVRFTYEVMPPR